ncbi:MAG: cation transporter [Alicyclobacillus sp.]|nr:cation transporter [Alicyclobacillus sp.]
MSSGGIVVAFQTVSVGRCLRVEMGSVAWMVVEAAGAIGSGIAAHSLALTAFGADSVIELVAGTVLLWRLLIEARGADARQVARAEKVASWVVGVALLLLALYIVAGSVDKLVQRQGAETSPLGIALAVASAVIMPYLAGLKRRLGAEIGSRALRADGSCSMVCAYMAWILLAGVALTALTGWWWMDAVAALGLVYYVAHEGWEAVQTARGEADGCCDD